MPSTKKSTGAQRAPSTSKTYTDMFQAYAAFWRRGFTEWAGTSSRSEYWWTVLANILIVLLWGVLVSMVWMIMDIFGAAGYFWYWNDGTLLAMPLVVWGIAMFIPNVSLLVRRLHDAGFSAWWLLLLLGFGVQGADAIISLVFLVFVLLPTKTDGNPYHKNNK